MIPYVTPSQNSLIFTSPLFQLTRKEYFSLEKKRKCSRSWSSRCRSIEDVSYKSSEIYEKFSIKDDLPYILVVQHPVTSSTDEVEAQITETLEACAESGYPTLLANPNDDAGGRKILSLMKYMLKDMKRFRFFHLFLVESYLPVLWHMQE